MFFNRQKKTVAGNETFDNLMPHDVPIAKSVNIDDIINSAMHDVKDQIDNYSEVCDILAMGAVNPHAFIDKVYLMIKSLNFQAVGVWLVNNLKPEEGCQLASRGFHNEIPPDVIAEWNSCITNGSVNWDRLMEISQHRNSAFSRMVDNEQLDRVGYAPIEDGCQVLGFLIIGATADQEPSIVASSLIEQCGSRIGLILSAEANDKITVDGKTFNGKKIKKKLQTVSSSLKMLQEADDVSIEELSRTIEKCRELTEEVCRLLP